MSVFNSDSLQALYRYACVLCRSQDDAYDLVQYALEKYLRQHATRRYDMDMAYVRSIMRNRYIDMYRRSNRFPEERYDDSNTVALDASTLEDIVIAQSDLERVWQSLDAFEREILYYWAVEGMTAVEIAAQTDTPRGTVLSRIYRVRKKIESQTGRGQMFEGYKS